MNICFLIPTYKRNLSLKRLLGSLSHALSTYRGPNIYRIVVTDSDHSNPSATTLSRLPSVTYILNPGKGFDDNMYHAYLRFATQSDYIFSISDDDLPVPYPPNVLDWIDIAAAQGQHACLLNHFDYEMIGGGEYSRSTLQGCKALHR